LKKLQYASDERYRELEMLKNTRIRELEDKIREIQSNNDNKNGEWSEKIRQKEK
jgi:hypothetical protein